jgi:NAD(P)-dependent dehydrogenase (short-subunit alcohol dehydrogenase family)
MPPLLNSSTPFNLDLGLRESHVLVTGGCGLIGKVVVQAFLAAGARVTILDLTDNCPFDQNDENILYYKADIINADQMDAAFAKAEDRFGAVQTCVALASLDLSVLHPTESLADMEPKHWQRVLGVNVNGTFMTCQRWLRSVRQAASDSKKASELRNVSLVIVGSEAGRFGVRTMAAYSAGKSAVQYGLLQSLAQDAPRLFSRARVNAVAPGPVDTERFREETKQFGEEWRWKECEAT